VGTSLTWPSSRPLQAMSTDDDPTSFQHDPLHESESMSLLTGGASSVNISLKKERNILHRFALSHILKHEYPLYRLGRLLIGIALILLINMGTRCLDHLTAIFNFYLCVSNDKNAMTDIREVLVGGLLGTLAGGLIQAATIAASGPYAVAGAFCTVNASSVNATEIATAALNSYTTLYTWNQVWSLPVGVAVVYYTLHVLRLEGPDFLQVGTAVISVLAIVLIDFPYFPLVHLLDECEMWTPVIQNWVTRALSLGCACFVATIFYFGFLGYTSIVDSCKEKRKQDRFLRSSSL